MERLVNAYEVLGIELSASDETIVAAYRARVKEHHPDVGGDAESFRRIADAYRLVRDPVERRCLDRWHRANRVCPACHLVVPLCGECGYCDPADVAAAVAAGVAASVAPAVPSVHSPRMGEA